MSALELPDDVGFTPDSENPAEDSATFLRLKKMVVQGERHRRTWRVEAQRAYDFVANHQWSNEDLQLLASQNRPSVSFNRASPIIEAVCGLEVNNRQSVAYLPRQAGAAGINEAYTAAARWVRDECGAEDEESEAFKDLVISGEGWTETAMNFDDDAKGKIVEIRVDPLEMGVDMNAARANYVDSRGVWRVRTLSVEDAQALLGGAYEAGAIHARWLEDTDIPEDGGMGNKTDYPAETREALRNNFNIRDRVRLVQIQWWDREDTVLLAEKGAQDLQELNPQDFMSYQGRVAQLTQADQQAQAAHATAMQNHEADTAAHHVGVAEGSIDPSTPPPTPPTPPTAQAPDYTHAVVKKKCYYEAFLGSTIFGKRKLTMGQFQFKAMTGKRDRKKKCFYGLMRDMFDPQMWANKWMSQTMHILNTNAKGGIMAETDAFVNIRKAETDWADNTKIVWVKPGSLTKKKIQERQAPPLPQGLGELMQFALTALRDVTGVNLELLGQADREQAASLEMQRRQSAMTILATIFDSLRRYRKNQGRLLLHFIQLLPNGTLIRVLDQNAYKYVPLMKEPDIEQFDVIIDQTPSTPDQKQATWAVTIELIRSGIPLPPPVLMTLLKYSPYPESVVQEIMNAAGMGQDMPPEMMKQKLQQAEQALQALEQALQQAQANAKTAEDERTIKATKTLIEGYNAETKRLAAELTGANQMFDRAALTTIKAAELSIPAPGGPDGGGPGPTPDVSGIQGIASANSTPPGMPPQPGQDQGGGGELSLAAVAQKVDGIAHLLGALIQGIGGQGGPPIPTVHNRRVTHPQVEAIRALGQERIGA